MEDIPTCVTFAQCYREQAHRIRLIGTYTKHLVFGRFDGLVHIQMPDCESGPVLDICWGPRGRRREAEIAELEGRYVVVVGRFYLSTGAPPDDPPDASHYDPPFISVESIRLAEPHEIPDLGTVEPFRWPSLYDD